MGIEDTKMTIKVPVVVSIELDHYIQPDRREDVRGVGGDEHELVEIGHPSDELKATVRNILSSDRVTVTDVCAPNSYMISATPDGKR